jgi:beta-glucosidase
MLNAHASVVEVYREEFQQQQGGIIGITLNHDWAEPLTQSDEDREAADIRNEFAMGWYERY